jgi:hypothetical protein
LARARSFEHQLTLERDQETRAIQRDREDLEWIGDLTVQAELAFDQERHVVAYGDGRGVEDAAVQQAWTEALSPATTCAWLSWDRQERKDSGAIPLVRRMMLNAQRREPRSIQSAHAANTRLRVQREHLLMGGASGHLKRGKLA